MLKCLKCGQKLPDIYFNQSGSNSLICDVCYIDLMKLSKNNNDEVLDMFLGPYKVCLRCGKNISLDNFYEMRGSGDGVFGECKKCCGLENIPGWRYLVYKKKQHKRYRLYFGISGEYDD